MNIKLQTNERLSATVADGLAGVFVNGVSLSASLSGKADVSAIPTNISQLSNDSGYITSVDVPTKTSQISNDSGFITSANISSKADVSALQNYYTKSETSSASELSTAFENSGGKVYFDNRVSGVTGSNDLSVVKLSADEYAQMLDGGTCLSNAIYIVEAPNIDAFKQRITNVAPPVDLSDAATKEYVDNALTNVQIPTDLSSFTNSPGYTTNVGTITGITMNGASKGTSGNVDLGTVLTAHQSLSNCLQNNSSYDSINLTATGGIRLASDVRIDNGYGFTVKDDYQDSYTTVNLTGVSVKEYLEAETDDQTNIGAAYITMSTLRPIQLPPSELLKYIKFTTKTYNTSQTSSLANIIYTKSETSSATEISTAVNQKSTVSFNQITTTGTNIGSITIDGTTTQIYAPTGGGGGGSSVQVSADYQTGTRVATISVDSIPTSIYVPNSGGGSSRYALVTAQLVSDNGSLTCAVNDQTITTIQVSSSATPVVVQLPAQPADGARDFILRIEISSSAAPTFTFNGVNETIDFDSEDDDWAIMEPGLNLVSFTETKRGN